MTVHSLEHMPLVGPDVHPWRMDNLHGATATKPVYLLSSNVSIETGDTSGCTEVDVHFFQVGLFYPPLCFALGGGLTLCSRC